MNRLPELPPEALTPEQRRVHDAIASGPRGSVRGPFLAWLRNPEFADAAQKVGEYCRFRTTLSRDLAEIAICVTAAHYRAEFEWWAHSRMAHEAGVPEQLTEAIRTGSQPEFENDRARVVWHTARALNERHRLTDPEFAEARTVLGEEGLVDVIGLCGYYALVSLTLNTFEVPVPDGSRAFDPAG
jgi:4-carboxymuconolactone decarboxylase